jgi:DNA-binding LytR/AlgR family response regulator
MMNGQRRVLLHLDQFRRVPVDPQKIYYLEADGNDTLVRTAASRRRRDVRALADVVAIVQRHGFVRIHRTFAVNINRIREIRRRRASELWEIRLQPPVHQVLPVSSSYVNALWKAFGET